MSVDDGAGGPGGREVAHRLFAAEFDDADLDHSESDEERAPNYVVTPTGARVNRLFVVGVLTEVERVGDEVLRARVVDPTGAFVVYAGQYQPEAMGFLDDATTPAFVAVSGKARTFEPDDGDRVYTSIRPESVTEVGAEERDRWVVGTAEHTLDRVARMADAVDRPERGDDLRAALAADGVPESLAAGVPLALDHYGTTETYLAAVRDLALDAVRVVTGDRDEVEELTVAPDEGGAADRDLSFDGLDDGGEADVESADAEAASVDVDADETEAATADGDGASPEGDGESAPDEEFDLDEEEREAVIEEHGVEFSSGTDIPDAGEADIETPDATGVADAEVADSEADDGAEPAEAADGDHAATEVEDLEDTVVDYMSDLDDGDGVPRDDLVAAVAGDHDVSAEAVEDAVQDALMAGRCYESGDDELSPI